MKPLGLSMLRILQGAGKDWGEESKLLKPDLHPLLFLPFSLTYFGCFQFFLILESFIVHFSHSQPQFIYFLDQILSEGKKQDQKQQSNSVNKTEQ